MQTVRLPWLFSADQDYFLRSRDAVFQDDRSQFTVYRTLTHYCISLWQKENSFLFKFQTQLTSHHAAGLRLSTEATRLNGKNLTMVCDVLSVKQKQRNSLTCRPARGGKMILPEIVTTPCNFKPKIPLFLTRVQYSLIIKARKNTTEQV